MARAALVAVLLGLLPVLASAAQGTVTLTPVAGPAGQSFTATFSFDAGSCNSYQVGFTWDGSAIGSVVRASGGKPCRASLTTSPPARDNGVGRHLVGAFTFPSGFTGSAYYTITSSGPSPTPKTSPRPSPRPSASPSPKPSPTPRASAVPSAPPPPLVCEPSSVAAVPAQTPTFAGDLTVQGVVSTIAVTQAGPPSMLPPELGHHVLVAMLLSKPEDALSSTLQDALTRGTVFPCALLGLGQTLTFSYARYAFTNVQVIGLQSALDPSFKMQETFTLTYDTVRWQYQLAGDSEPTEGSAHYGSGSRPVAQSTAKGGFPWAWVAGVLLVLLAVGAAWLRLRSRRPLRP